MNDGNRDSNVGKNGNRKSDKRKKQERLDRDIPRRSAKSTVHPRRRVEKHAVVMKGRRLI